MCARARRYWGGRDGRAGGRRRGGGRCSALSGAAGAEGPGGRWVRRAGPVRSGRSGGAAQGKFRKALYPRGNGGMLLRERKAVSDGHSENKAGAAQVVFSPGIAFFNIKKKNPHNQPNNKKNHRSLDFCLILDALVERLQISENV